MIGMVLVPSKTSEEIRRLENAVEFLRFEAESTLEQYGEGEVSLETFECVASAYASFNKLLKELMSAKEATAGGSQDSTHRRVTQRCPRIKVAR